MSRSHLIIPLTPHFHLTLVRRTNMENPLLNSMLLQVFRIFIAPVECLTLDHSVVLFSALWGGRDCTRIRNLQIFSGNRQIYDLAHVSCAPLEMIGHP